MSNVSLRYYKKPKNKLGKNLKNSFAMGTKKPILLISIIALLFFVLFLIFILPRLSTQLNNEVFIQEDMPGMPAESTYLYSKNPFYADYENKILIAHKMENNSDTKYIVNLGRIDKDKKVFIGPYQNFIFFQRPLTAIKTLSVVPKFSINSDFRIIVKDDYDTNNFTYEIETIGDMAEYTIIDGEQIIYQAGLSDNKCDKKPDTKTIYLCKAAFNDSNSKILNIKIRDKNNRIYEVIRNKLVNFTGGIRVVCNFVEEPKVGENDVVCKSPVNADVFIQDKNYKLESSKGTSVKITAKTGKNSFLIVGSDDKKQKIEQLINYEVSSTFYFDLGPSKDQYPLESPTNLEFLVNTNEKLTLDIAATAKDSKLGYSNYNSDGTETDFKNVTYVNKGVKFDPINNSIIFQIDTRSEENVNKKSLYPDTISVNFIIKSETGKNLQASCKMIVKVTENTKDKSSCTTKNII
jgi:hypothetical protein